MQFSQKNVKNVKNVRYEREDQYGIVWAIDIIWPAMYESSVVIVVKSSWIKTNFHRIIWLIKCAYSD